MELKDCARQIPALEMFIFQNFLEGYILVMRIKAVKIIFVFLSIKYLL